MNKLQAIMTDETLSVRERMEAALAEGKLVQQAAEKVQNRREGVYATFTRIASETGRDAFEGAVTDLEQRIVANVEGTAVRIGAKLNKKGDAFAIPENLRSAKSVLLGAFDHGIPMLDDEADAPRSFSAIRKDVQAAKKAAEDAKKSDVQVDAETLIADLREMLDGLAGREFDAAMLESLQQYHTDSKGWLATFADVAGDEEQAADSKAA